MNNKNIPLVPEDMTDEGNRLQTFGKHWQDGYPVTASSLAKAGLYYLGPSDRVRCAFCAGILRNWELGDSAFGEHARWYPTCPFVKEVKSAPLIRPQTSEYKALSSLGYSEAIISQAFDICCCAEKEPSVSQLLDAIHSIEDAEGKFQVDDMRIEINRLGSYGHNWIDDLPVTAPSLAKAGLFYVGPHDRVRCAFCQGEIHEWKSGDSALGEHTRLFPTCPFIRNRAVDDAAESHVPELELLEDDPAETNANQRELADVLRENVALKAERRCHVCQKAESVCIFLPCGHIACCMACGHDKENCILCAKKILGYLQCFR